MPGCRNDPMYACLRRQTNQSNPITGDRGALAHDGLDALAMAVAYFTQPTTVDHAKEAQRTARGG